MCSVVLQALKWLNLSITGGTLKIYGSSLCPDVPYKTLLLSVGDSAAMVVREMLDKYGLSRQDPQQYCIVQVCSFIPCVWYLINKITLCVAIFIVVNISFQKFTSFFFSIIVGSRFLDVSSFKALLIYRDKNT